MIERVLIGGLDKTEKYGVMLRALSRYIDKLVESESEALAMKLQENIRYYAPGPKGYAPGPGKKSVTATGKLWRSIRVRKLATGKWTCYVSARKDGVDYAWLQEKGIGKIRRAKGEGYMIFKHNITGKVVKVKEAEDIGTGDVGKYTKGYITKGFADTVKWVHNYTNQIVDDLDKIYRRHYKK